MTEPVAVNLGLSTQSVITLEDDQVSAGPELSVGTSVEWSDAQFSYFVSGRDFNQRGPHHETVHK